MRVNKNLKQYKKPTNLRTIIVKDIVVLIILGGGIALLYWIYNYSNWPPIRNFNVYSQNGSLQYVTAQEINSILEPYRTGLNFLNINLNQVKQKFEQKEWIDSVEVERSWPHTINITISERIPIAYWDSKKSYLVDDKGNLFRGSFHQSLVHFKGAPNTQKIIFDLYQQVNPLLQKHSLELNKIEYIMRSWVLYVGDIKIFLGRENIVNKLLLLLSVWDKLLESDSREIHEIHMEYRDGFSVKY